MKIAEALGMKTLIVSPTTVILMQNAEETTEFTDSEVGKYYEGSKDLSKKITHITYHSLIRAVKGRIIKPEDIPVLILDEAHGSLGPERSRVVSKFKGLRLGFSATTEFSGDKTLTHLLKEEIFRMDVSEAIQEGLICQTQAIHAFTNVDMSSVQIAEGKYDQEQLEKVVNTQGRNLAAVELYEKKFSHLKAFINCAGVTHTREVAELFNKRGIPAACITEDTGEGERKHIRNQYKSGAIRILTNARVLREGFNEPTCSVTFNLHPTLSPVVAEQRVRSGRLDKDDPNKWNYVVDFIDQNAKRPQLLYSEVLGAAKLWDTSKPQPNTLQPTAAGQIREPRLPIEFNDLSLEGLRVVVNTQNVMEVTKRNLDEREKWTFDALQKEVRAERIQSAYEYESNAPSHKWPSRITLVTMPEFPKNPDSSNDWDTFLGREKKEKSDFVKIQAEVKAQHITSTIEYRRNRLKNKWPSDTVLAKMSEFPKNPDGSNDWDTFFGREKFNFVKLQAEARAKGIKTSADYARDYSANEWPDPNTLRRRPESPKNPDGSFDWDTFLGREKGRDKFDLAKLQAEVKAKGLMSSGEYNRIYVANEWPSIPTLISHPKFPKKSDGSNDWAEFFGTKKK